APTDELELLPFDEVAAATRDALAAVLELREQEGEALARDLLDSLKGIDTALAAIETRAP
ncbi:MAG: hypothetical protein GWN71_03790, partial [Gammaproteobacteria bacterium]|nr:hypothetical protein [Gemmatimonadota bacterium]NIU72723.1 hypothetical protein [Gammaproteobacteria bacterium]